MTFRQQQHSKLFCISNKCCLNEIWCSTQTCLSKLARILFLIAINFHRCVADRRTRSRIFLNIFRHLTLFLCSHWQNRIPTQPQTILHCAKMLLDVLEKPENL